MKLFSINKVLMLGLITIASFSSCKKLIEIPANPPTAITQQQQFADSATAITAVAGTYNYTAGQGFAFTDGAVTASGGLSADELTYTQSNDNPQFYNYTLTTLNNEVITLWSHPYQSIYQVNAVISGVTGSSGLSASFQKQVVGEMEVMRALNYFTLVNLFDGVPLVTSTDYNQNYRLPRATADAVYAQVFADLYDARKKLTSAYPSSGHARPNLYTAIALLSKVNLYRGNWQNAYNEADSVISQGNYHLEANLNNVFLDGSSEAIWQLPVNSSYLGVGDAGIFIPGYPGASVNYLLNKPLLNAFEAGDQRNQNWVGATVVNGNTLYYPSKYKNYQATKTPTEDQMVLRLAELYLIRAEAAAHLNKLSQALADVNMIRTRAGLPVSTAANSQAAVLNVVMHERQVELFCEWSNRWFDLKRTGTAAAVLGAEKTGYTANAALYPLPQSEMLLNNLLKQNPGY
jgi:hypothetical protein